MEARVPEPTVLREAAHGGAVTRSEVRWVWVTRRELRASLGRGWSNLPWGVVELVAERLDLAFEQGLEV